MEEGDLDSKTCNFTHLTDFAIFTTSDGTDDDDDNAYLVQFFFFLIFFFLALSILYAIGLYHCSVLIQLRIFIFFFSYFSKFK